MSLYNSKYFSIFKMKTIITFLLALALVQALIPRNIEIPEDKLFPKKTLKEWQKILKNIEYYPSNAPKTKGIPQPESSGKAMTPRIVGGTNAVEGQFPWQVAVHMDDKYFCGGSLISGNWVLTAGHCIDGILSFEVYAGTLSYWTGSEQQTSTTKILHSEFNSKTLENDIGLIHFKKSFNIGTKNINSIMLASSSIGSLVGTTARVSGWGKSSDSENSLTLGLKTVDLVIVDPYVCVSYYGEFFNSQICCAADKYRSTCEGDSGGPLSIMTSDGRWIQVGIVSFVSKKSCESGYPLGFTRVNSFLDWISSNTGLSL